MPLRWNLVKLLKMTLLKYKMNRWTLASLQLRAANIFIKWKPQTGTYLSCTVCCLISFRKKDHIRTHTNGKISFLLKCISCLMSFPFFFWTIYISLFIHDWRPSWLCTTLSIFMKWVGKWPFCRGICFPFCRGTFKGVSWTMRVGDIMASKRGQPSKRAPPEIVALIRP